MDIENLEEKAPLILFLTSFMTIQLRPPSIQIPQPVDISWPTDGIAEEDTNQPDDSLTALAVIAADNMRSIVKEVHVKMEDAIDIVLSAKRPPCNNFKRIDRI